VDRIVHLQGTWLGCNGVIGVFAVAIAALVATATFMLGAATRGNRGLSDHPA